jgi:hypothetical protein
MWFDSSSVKLCNRDASTAEKRENSKKPPESLNFMRRFSETAAVIVVVLMTPRRHACLARTHADAAMK